MHPNTLSRARRDDVETLLNAHRMVAGLLITRDFATAIEVGLWVTKRSRLVKVFLGHLGRYPHEVTKLGPVAPPQSVA